MGRGASGGVTRNHHQGAALCFVNAPLSHDGANRPPRHPGLLLAPTGPLSDVERGLRP